MRRIESLLGPLDLVVANAGVGLPTDAARLDAGACRKLMRVNYEGAVNTFAAALPGMVSRGRGRIAAVSSLAAWRGLPGNGGYGASKAALSTLMQAMRIELAPVGVGVTVVHPGFIATPMTARNRFPMPFLLEADDAAERIVRGLERGRARVDFPWPMVLALGLVRLLPRPLYERAFLLARRKR